MKEFGAELQQRLKSYRISQSEYEIICSLLGREPRTVELALFSALWSEHCSYKSSKAHLSKFSYRNMNTPDFQGENAGVVDLGYGERIVFKMESHNHPSFIEPYQGAATGVGGILRDIFTMGARPIALADYLCFGRPNAARMSILVDGVVRGISGYGNCVGVPTITGSTEFDSSYNNNILVNAMAVGLLRSRDRVAFSAASGPGNWVVYVGAKTGKDGIHGASMASESFDGDSAAKKPNVQVGDPFYEKLLIESCLEALRLDLVVSMQDMGAAGLTSSSFEMAAKGGVGFDLHLDKVPLRSLDMGPEEILLSESQERMLLVCEPAKFADLARVFNRWGLEVVKIGEVRAEKNMRLWWKGELLTEIDPSLLVQKAPRYERPWRPWMPHCHKGELPRRCPDLLESLNKIASDVRMGPKDWIYRQYDQRVGLRTVRGAGADFGILRLPDTGRALAVVTGCRPAVMRLDAHLGGQDAVLFPALQMAAKGFKAMAVTDCLNFGNPERVEVMSEFVAAVEGIAAASRIIDAPVISGNVSFYNETLGQNITPTPATGLVGLRDNFENLPCDHFKSTGLAVYLWRCPMVQAWARSAEVLGGNREWTGALNLERVQLFIDSVRELTLRAKPLATRVPGDGGLAQALMKMCRGRIGFKSHSEALNHWDSDEFFREHFYEVLFVVEPAQRRDFERLLQRANDELYGWYDLIGYSQEDVFSLRFDQIFDLHKLLSRRESAWTTAFPELQ